ncbi:MAG: EAL domain-containing protein [Actinobacteria bacterium]|nr:EAL domain-containing protein [Actinomycetota bacterium]
MPVKRLWQAYLAFGLLCLLLYYFVPPFKQNGILFNVIGLSSAVTILIGIKLHKPKSRRAWQAFALGQLFFVTGDAFYYGYDQIFHQDVPFPSLGDLFYLAVYPALIFGLVMLVRRRNPFGDRTSLIDALILTTGLALMSWVFLMAPYAHDPDLSLLEKLASIAYPLMDVCLLAVAIRLAVDRGKRQPALTLLMLSIVSLLTADAILGALTLEGGYAEGGLLDMGWAAYYLLWGAAALHPTMKQLEDPVSNRVKAVSKARLSLLTGASLVPPAVQAVQVARGAALELPVMIGGSAVLFVLVVARMAGLIRDSERSAQRERALREAARALVGARSREEVYRAGLTSMRTLIGEEHPVRLTAFAASGELRAQSVDATGVKQEWLMRAADLTSLDAATLRRRGFLEIVLEGSGLTKALRFPPGGLEAMAFPLFVREELRGLIFIADSSSLSTQTKGAMQTLAVSISLTLESAILTEDLHRRKGEARFQSLVQNSSDLITVIDGRSIIQYQSPSVQRVLGYELDELLETNFSDLLHPHERERVLALMLDERENSPNTDVAVECQLRHCDGTWLIFEILRTNLLADPNVSGIVLNARDVSERKEFEQQLTHQAFHDPVTQLANRALFTNRVEHALSRQTRDAGGMAVLFVDLDDFKIINDSLGHAVGDEVLRLVGERLARCVRPMDTVARFGGDEYAVLLEDIQRRDQVVEIVDRAYEALNEVMNLDDKELFIRASIGIAMLDGEDALTSAADELLRNADVAMYRAKRDGKGAYRIYEAEMHSNVLERLELKGALQKAIDREEFQLYYQPIVGMGDGQVNGLEALVRWKHPERGIVLPGEFIPLAEETGQVGSVGEWVLREACRQMKFMQDLGLLTDAQSVCVNISVRQLQEGLVELVSDALTSSGLKPQCLTLEITETILMIDTEATIKKLHQLKALGIQLSVDDFGTGYSSLGYLSRFPVDVLKIDQTFIGQIASAGHGSVLVAAIVKLGEALNLKTIAEGIEVKDQADRLIELGCPLAQGYYFARPMGIDATLEYLGARIAVEGRHDAVPHNGA